jgi:hypothetical protein
MAKLDAAFDASPLYQNNILELEGSFIMTKRPESGG